MGQGKIYKCTYKSPLFDLPNKENAMDSIYMNITLLRDFMYKIAEKYIFIYYK